MIVEKLLKVLDDTKTVNIIDPIYGNVRSYKNCNQVGLGFRPCRVVMVTTHNDAINIVVKPPLNYSGKR